jgi:hypothetical protein
MVVRGDLWGHQHYLAFGFFGAGFFAGSTFTTGFGFGFGASTFSDLHPQFVPHLHLPAESKVSRLCSSCLNFLLLSWSFLNQLVKKFTCHSLLENEGHARMVLAYSSELVSRRGSVDDCSFSSVPFVVVSFWLLHLVQ